jgi:hypothetical protein
MSNLRATVEQFQGYVQTGPSGLSNGTALNYVNVIRSVLEKMDPEDLTDVQKLTYLKFGLPHGYQKAYPSAWKLFAEFLSNSYDIEVPKEIPLFRRNHYVHPISYDLHVLFGIYYNGIPKDLDWQKFVATEKDPKIVTAAQRAYEFFTNERQPRADQPLIPRGPESDVPVEDWLLDSILDSRRRVGTGPAELFHKDLNAQLAMAGMPVGVSKTLYGIFAVGGESIRRKTSGSRDEMFEECEKIIQARAGTTLIKTLKAYLGVKAEQEDEIAGVLFQ